MEQNKKASFEMDCSHRLVTQDGNCTMEYESVIGHGNLEFVSEDKKYDALCVLMKHYHKEDFPFNKDIMKKTMVFRLIVDFYTGKKRIVTK